MTPKILITGCNGQVGFELKRSLSSIGEVIALDRSGFDLSNPDSIRENIRRIQPSIIFNPAAYTAVDKAESDANMAQAVNAFALGIIGEEARKISALVIHYSTDYVFDGTQIAPYTETDSVNPLGVYGRTKLEGEIALTESGAKHLILRTSWVYGAHGKNFIKTILRLAASREELRIVADQFGAPTGAALLADASAHIAARFLRDRGENFPFGLYHLAAAGETSWHGFAQYIVAQATAAGLKLQASPDCILPIPTTEYPTPAARPANSRLDSSKFRAAFGLQTPDWKHGVDNVLDGLLEQ
jgi:dTDP-4-dehydrorhamnose reductase